MTEINKIEKKRLALQAKLDGGKTPEDRNHMGQFATPTTLAREILTHGVRLLPASEKIRFFDPGIGTGSFYSALRAVVVAERIESAAGFEIDPHYGKPAKAFWKGTKLNIRLEDFTQAEPEERLKANLLICNPPYVRHHHMDAAKKADLQCRTEKACGVKINGLSGLYCYFMGLSHKWMEQDGIAGWLVPSEFMGVNYGKMLKSYLLDKVTLLQVHRFDPEDVQFTDALVSSAVVWFKNAPPPSNHDVIFSYGGTLTEPALSRKVLASELAHEGKWTRYPQADKATIRVEITLGDLFDIKRGLATGDNSFFIMDRKKIEAYNLPMECFRPVLPGSRYIPSDEIKADKDGLPLIDMQFFLLHTSLSENDIAQRYPTLKAYLDTGRKGERPVAERYLCRSRRPWYAQENRPAAPIICTYMGRSRKGSKPFRFILNHSQATACNGYLMLYPKPLLAHAAAKDPEIMRTVWKFLNGIKVDELLSHGRVYGGGLHKLEPKELRGFPAEGLIARIPEIGALHRQLSLFEKAVI
ncbi:Eco57I restriction-modification methylase domain-containing protein [Geoalkalibacter subterraneus]|uniref:site-specific DNA-methyltransferase (adenine-specific) n=1 Tax=Geoalkalibacter subterraneus TaxID=483547 RepID=A0A0B5FUD0_9BACT|nr:Eco57I restriction-modification methylase domain-containing protein [Geoalkalibacter subterraneus]AJF08254.1 modification methylase SalI (adenine-specific methyltransferase SalI) (M.SalI) [Geoalkalibacter subterraneus]